MDKETEKLLEEKIQEHKLKCRNKCWCKKCADAIRCVDGCKVCIVRKQNKSVEDCFVNKEKNSHNYTYGDVSLRGNK